MVWPTSYDCKKETLALFGELTMVCLLREANEELRINL